MKSKFLLLVFITVSLISKSQVSELDNNSANTAHYLGWDASTTFPLNIRHNNNIANSDINFWTRNLQRMTLTDNGLVGIGLTAPTSLLHLGRTTNSLGSLFRTDGVQTNTNVWDLRTGGEL